MKSRLRIAIGSVFPQAEISVKGGIEAVAHYLSKALAEKDNIDLHIVSCSPFASHDFVEQRGNITVHWLKSSDRLYNIKVLTSDAWRVARVYHSIQPDVIHAQGFTEYATAVAPHQKLILSIHGLEAILPQATRMNHFRGFAGTYRRMTGKMIAHRCIRKSRGIIANAGEYTVKPFPHLFSGKHIFKIANPIAPDFFEVKNIPETERKTFNMLWVGVMTDRKNLLMLARGFAKVAAIYPNARLTLAGHIGESWYYEKLKQVLVDLNIESHVSVTGAISQQNILELYANADLFIFPSVEETAPMAMAQAMAAGLPVIASRVGGIPWMLDEGKAGWLEEPVDESGWVSSITRMIEQTETRRELGRLAKQRALNLFSVDSVAEQTLAAYQSLFDE
jgi:glycosyltransferase involved in cell wall biosynthesis